MGHALGAIAGTTAEGLARATAAAFFGGAAGWVGSGAADLVHALGGLLDATTAPALGAAAFRQELRTMTALAAAAALPFLVAGLLQAIARHDVGLALRSALVRLPCAVVLGGAAVELVELGVRAADGASEALLGAGSGTPGRLVARLAAALASPAGSGLWGFAGALVALVAAGVAFVLWLELALRAAAVLAAALFLPLALVGTAWPATSHWARRLAEVLAALVFSKVVVAGVLALGAGLVASPGGPGTGATGLVSGVALLALAALAPFALLRLVPIVEAAAVGHLEGLARRAGHSALRAASRGAGLVSGEGTGTAALLGEAGGDGLGVSVGDRDPDRSDGGPDGASILLAGRGSGEQGRRGEGGDGPVPRAAGMAPPADFAARVARFEAELSPGAACRVGEERIGGGEGEEGPLTQSGSASGEGGGDA